MNNRNRVRAVEEAARTAQAVRGEFIEERVFLRRFSQVVRENEGKVFVTGKQFVQVPKEPAHVSRVVLLSEHTPGQGIDYHDLRAGFFNFARQRRGSPGGIEKHLLWPGEIIHPLRRRGFQRVIPPLHTLLQSDLADLEVQIQHRRRFGNSEMPPHLAPRSEPVNEVEQEKTLPHLRISADEQYPAARQNPVGNPNGILRRRR